MRNAFISSCALFFVLMLPFLSAAQGNEKVLANRGHEEAENIFCSPLIINNQTSTVLSRKEVELTYEQRFGRTNGTNDVFGLNGLSNFRIGLDYGLTNKLNAGVAVSKNKSTLEASVKYVLFNQDAARHLPFTLAYYGEASRDGLEENRTNEQGVYSPLHRMSYFHELMLARKITERLSLQTSFTFSYFNLAEAHRDNGNAGLSFVGTYGLSTHTVLIFDFDYTIASTTHHPLKPNMGLGLAFTTKPGVIQVFITTSEETSNDERRVSNHNDFAKGEFTVGFNLTPHFKFGVH